MNTSTIKKQPPTTILGECRICGVSARYSHFGVRSCFPCKMFFKRNAERELEALKCDFNNDCEININTRHVCSYCRLKKCLQCGMKIPINQSKRTSEERNVLTNPIGTTSRVLVRLNEPIQLPTLNLLRSDQSTLTIEQWNLISNLSKCYDEYSGLSIGEHYMREQSQLLPKLRYKSTSLIGIYQMIIDGAQLLYKNNRHFQSLSPDDRSVLLHTTVKPIASFSANSIFYQVRLLNEPAYYETIAIITNPLVVDFSRRIANGFDFDMIIIKLFLAILSFSTTNFTVYSNSPAVNLSNIKQILHIQNTYVELLWRYLLYKYNFEYAVRCLSQLIRCVSNIISGIGLAHTTTWFEHAVHSITQKTEENLTFNN